MSRQSKAELLAALSPAFRAHQRAVDALDEAAAAVFGINRTDLRGLDVLLERGTATPTALAEELGLTSGSVTALLDRLERAGYAERAADPDDRRRTRVRPTRRAAHLAERIYGPLAGEGGQLMARYSAGELKAFLDFLQWGRALQDAHAARVRAMPAARASR
ncbi:MAG: MarR family transcriptional regulator [bacterium]